MSITFCYACGYCFDLLLCKEIDFKLQKLFGEYNFQEKLCINCTFKFMQTTKILIFYASGYIVRLQVLICYVNTCLQCNFNRFLLKRAGLSVVSDPPNVLRDTQGRLIMWKLEFLIRSIRTMIMLCTAIFTFC